MDKSLEQPLVDLPRRGSDACEPSPPPSGAAAAALHHFHPYFFVLGLFPPPGCSASPRTAAASRVAFLLLLGIGLSGIGIFVYVVQTNETYRTAVGLSWRVVDTGTSWVAAIFSWMAIRSILSHSELESMVELADVRGSQKTRVDRMTRIVFWLVFLGITLLLIFNLLFLVMAAEVSSYRQGLPLGWIVPLALTVSLLILPCLVCQGLWLTLALLLRVRMQLLATRFDAMELPRDFRPMLKAVSETANASSRLSSQLATFFIPFLFFLGLRYFVTVVALASFSEADKGFFAIAISLSFALYLATVFFIPFVVGAYTTSAAAHMRKALTNRYVELCLRGEAADMTPEAHDAFSRLSAFIQFEKPRLRLRVAGLSLTFGLLTKVFAIFLSVTVFVFNPPFESVFWNAA